MSQVEDLLNSLTEDELKARAADMAIEPRIVIDESRIVFVPDELKRIGVQYDHNIETVVFDVPRFWDGHDLSRMKIYINYMSGNGRPGCYIADEVKVDEQDENRFRFEWTISANVTEYKGKIPFLVCAKKTDENGNESLHWNSELNTEMYVSEGLECMETIEKLYPDIYTQLLYRMDEYEKIGKEYMDTTISYAVGTNGEFREGDETDNAKYYYELSKSYTVGTGGVTREGDDTDNAKYYKEGAETSAANAADSETNAKASEDIIVQKVEEAQEIVNTSQEHLEEIIIERKRIETVVENSENPLISSMATSYEELMAVEELGTIPDAVAVRDGIIDAKNNPITYTTNKLDENGIDISLPTGFVIADLIEVDGRFIAIGSRTVDDVTTNYVAISEDGIDWSDGYEQSTDYGMFKKIAVGLVEGIQKYVVITDGKYILTSTSERDLSNNINITSSSIALMDISYCDYNNGMFVVCLYDGTSDECIYISYNGIEWTFANLSKEISNSAINSIYANGKFIAIGTYDSAVSSNGVDWIVYDDTMLHQDSNQSEFLPLPSSPFNKMIYADGMFVVVGPTRYVYSSEGLMNGYVKTGYHPIIFYSANGTNDWKYIVCPINDIGGTSSDKPSITWISYNHGLFFVIGHMPSTGNSILMSLELDFTANYLNIIQKITVSDSDIYNYLISNDNGIIALGNELGKKFEYVTENKNLPELVTSSLINENREGFYFGVLNGIRGYYTDFERTEENFHAFDPSDRMISTAEDVMVNDVSGYIVDSLVVKDAFNRLGEFAFRFNPSLLCKKDDGTPVAIAVTNNFLCMSEISASTIRKFKLSYIYNLNDYNRLLYIVRYRYTKEGITYIADYIHTDDEGNEYCVLADSPLGLEVINNSVGGDPEYFASSGGMTLNNSYIVSFEEGLLTRSWGDAELALALKKWQANYTINTIEGGFYGRAGADTVRPFSKKRDVSKLERINIASITQTSSGTTGGSSGSIEVLYDGAATFNDANSTGLSYYVQSSSLTLEITVDKPFYLAFIRTPYKSNNSVVNPTSFIIGDYTSPTISRVSQTWTKIPYIGDDMDYLELDTTFEITLKGGTYIGLTELEIYGFYKE